MSLFNFDHRTSGLVLAGGALALAGAVIGAGCGGTDVSTQEGFCSALAAADCSYAIVQACYGSSDASLQADIDSCITARRQANICNPAHLPYHADFADGCISQHQTVFGASTIDGTNWDSVREACLPTFNRGGQKGSVCTDDVDCDVGYNGLRCIMRVGGKGTCQVPKAVAGGASCKDAAAQCPAGNYCDPGFHCVETPLKGEECGAGQPCSDGYRCNADLTTCENQLANGSKCARDTDCSGGFCLDTATGKQCAASYIFAFGATTCVDFKR